MLIQKQTAHITYYLINQTMATEKGLVLITKLFTLQKKHS